MAEENNNIETLSYKISVDTSDIPKAEERIRSLKDASKDLKDELGNPVNPQINVEKIKDVANALDKGTKSAKEFTNATANLGKSAGSGGVENITKAAEKLDTNIAKAKLNVDDLGKAIGKLSHSGLDGLKKELDGIMQSLNGNGGKKIPTIDEAMNRLNGMKSDFGGDLPGTDGWYKSLQKILEGYSKIAVEAGFTLKSLQQTASKPVTAKTDTKPIKEVSTESTKAESSVKKLNNAVENLGKAPAKSGAKKVAKEIEEIELGAIKAGQSIKQMVKSLDVRGVEKVVRDVNTAFGWDSSKNAGEPSPVEQVMSDIMRENKRTLVEGSKEYFELKRDVAADLAMQVKTMGGELPSLGITRQADAKANAKKGKQANGSSDLQLSNQDITKLKKLLHNDPAAFNAIASELTGRNINADWEKMKLFYQQGARERADHREQSPERQRLKETRRQIKEIQDAHKAEAKSEQKAAMTVAEYNRRQTQARQTMSALWHNKRVTSRNIDTAFADVEKRLGRKLPEEYFSIPKENIARRASYLKWIDDRVNGKGNFKESEYSIMQELYGKRVNKGNINKAFTEVEGMAKELKLLKGKAAKEYKAIPADDMFERAKYLRGVVEKYEEASQQQFRIEKKASESVKDAVNDVADTKGKKAKESTATVTKESKKQAEAEIASAKKATAETQMTWKDIEKTFQNMSHKDINKYAKDVDKFWKEYYKDRRGKKQTVNELTKELAGADVRQGSDAWYDSKREALFKLTKQMMRAKYELESLQKAEKSEAETVKGNTKAISENNEAVAKGKKGKKGQDSEKAPKTTDEEWKAFKEKHQADVAHLPTKKEQNQALYKMLQEEKKANAEVGKSAAESVEKVETAEETKTNAKKKSSSQSKKSSQEEVKENKEVAQSAVDTANKVEQSEQKKSNAKKKSKGTKLTKEEWQDFKEKHKAEVEHLPTEKERNKALYKMYQEQERANKEAGQSDVDTANKVEQSEQKKSNAKKKSTNQSKKSAEEEVKSNKEVSKSATESADKVEEAEKKKSNAKKKSTGQSAKPTKEEWQDFKEKYEAEVAHLATAKERNQALWKMYQEQAKQVKVETKAVKDNTNAVAENNEVTEKGAKGKKGKTSTVTEQTKAETKAIKENTKAVAENNEVVEKGKKSKKGNTSKVVEQTKAETESVKENTKVVANSKANLESLKASVAKMSHQELDAFGTKVDKYWENVHQKKGGARYLTVDELTKYSGDYVDDKNPSMWYDYKRRVLQDQIRRITENGGSLEALQSMMGYQQVEAEKKASESVKKEVEQVANAKTEATNKTEQAETKKSNARKKSASQSKKSSEEEIKADEKVAQTATEAAKKVEQAETKKSNARKKSASQSKKSAVDDEEAKKQRIAKLQGQADEFAAGLKRNMDSAPHNGHFKSFENYEKIKARERKVIDQLSAYGVQREPSYNKSWDDYVKEFNSNSSIAKAKAAKEVLAEQKRLESEAAKQAKARQKAEDDAAKVAAQNAKNATTALESYIRVRDRYLKNTANGKAIEEGQYAKMQRQLAEARNVLEQNGKEVPSFNMPSRDIHVREAEANRARIQSARELKNAEDDIAKIRQKQISLITRGKQLTDDQYRMIKAAGEEAQKQAKAAGSQKDISMPFDNPKYGNVTNFNREAIIQHAMSWNHQGVDSYSNSINRLIHAQEALYSAYQRDPHPKYLQMLGKTRAELSKVTKEYKKYQHQINDTGTTYDKFMVRARSHLEWIASGAALSAMFVLPTMFSNTLENLEARMAGIKQVIPMIEGLEDNQFGSKEMQLTRAKKEMQDLINIAAKYGAGVDEVMEATRSIGRMYGQGSLGVTNTNLMATQATRMAVADAFDLIDATKGLESAMSQWNLQTENTADLLINTNRILDVWTKTAHRGAASAQDIADAIQLAGTAANQAGVSFEFFNALVATGVRATARSGNEIGTSLKSMMVSMQTEKAEKALKEWGISLKEIGEDGVMRMRNLEDVILDVSMLVQSTEKDTSKLLLALSGGKFQYSKVSAILKNGDELMRMLKELNNPDTVGFTSQQIEVQLDTLSRKLNTIKDDLQGLVFNVGGIESMKEFADMLDRVILGFSSMAKALDSNAVSMAATVVKWGILYRVITKVAELIGVTYQSFKMLSTAQVTSTVATQGFLGVLQSLFTGFINNTKALATGRMARAGYTVETKKSEVATNQDTVATEANTAAHTSNTIAINANTVSYKNNAVAQGTLIGGATKSGKALGVLGKAAGFAGGAIAALGGPIGIGIMLLTVAIPLVYEYASALGEVENETRKKVDALNKDVELTEQQIQKAAQSAESMKRLARVYNEIADSLNDCTEGTKEYTVKQQQLKSIEESIMSVVRDDANIFDENQRIRMDALDEWMKTYVKTKREEQEGQLQTAMKHKDATEQELGDTKRRIEALSYEQKALKETGSTWSWFTKMLTQAHMIAGQAMKDLGDFTNSETLKKMGEDAIESSKKALTGAGGEGTGDLDAVEAELKKMRELEMQQEETKTDLNGKILMLQQSLLHGDNPNPHNPEERGTVEPDEEGGSGRGSGGSGSGSGSGSGGGKSRLPYESDELAAAIHEAAQTQYAKDNSLTEPLLRGLADVQSGLSQDFNDGVRIGAFGVTEEMGKRFGQDVYTPIGNAMTAVLALTQKISDAGGDMGAALNSFTGGNASGVYAAMRTQQDAYNYDGTDYIGSSDFGADVIAAARQRLGLPYGGSDLSDEFQAVCTTFVQRALVDAGADEDIVRGLTADANNWAKNAGAAFHPYGDGYAPKPGDIALTGIDESGHSGHVNMVDENGTGYYSAGGSAGVSAHYDTPIETAYEDDIEGYIDIAALTGKTRGLGLRSKGSNARKSVFDFRRSAYERLMYQIQKAKEDYEDTAKDIELERAMSGDSYELAAREQLNEQAKLTVEQNSLKLMEAMYKGVQKSIENTIKNAPDLQVALGQEGARWADLVPEEKKQLASLYKNDNGVFAELVNEEIKLHDALREQAKVVKEQTLKANKYLHMSIEEATKFENERLQMKFENFEASLPDDNQSTYMRDFQVNRAKQEMLKGQITNKTTERDYKYNQYTEAVAKDKKQLAEYEAKIQAGKENLANLQKEAEAGRNVTKAIEEQNQELTELIATYDVLGRIGSPETKRLERAFYEADTAVKQLQKDLDKVAKQDLQNVRNYGAQMFTDLIVEGKDFEDVWESLWKDLARYTINAIFGANNSGNIWGSIFGLFTGGGNADGGLFAKGGRIPGYAQGGGMIKGAGTGTSDSILAYLANKDRFVYLSNGEYVMTAEATKRLGVENLDALNGYADGGALSPTPYVPTLSSRASKRAVAFSNKNPNARMEQLMQEQTNVIQGMGNNDSGRIVVLNTRASSSDVLKAIQENPRAVQTILGQQRRSGFR